MSEPTNPRADLYVGPEPGSRPSRAEYRAGRKGFVLMGVWTAAVLAFTGYAQQDGMVAWEGVVAFVFVLSTIAFNLWWRGFLTKLRSSQGRPT
jgi:hypothetical protein